MKANGLFIHLLKQLFKNAFQLLMSLIDDDRQGPNKGSSSRTLLSFLRIVIFLGCIFSFIGVDVIKLIFRKNLGYRGINFFFLSICIIIFLCCSMAGGALARTELINPLNTIFAFIFYIGLAIYLTKKGYKHWKDRENILFNNPTSNPYDEGNSYLLIGLVNDGWTEKKVQRIAEPILTIAFGCFMFGFLSILALPIIYCGLSVWLYEITIRVLGYNPAKAIIAEKGYNAGSDNGAYVN